MKNILAIADVIVFATTCITVASQSLPCRTANGDNCPSVICPNTVVSYTCTISGTAAGFTDWILPTGTCPTNSFPDKIRLSQFVSIACAAAGSSTCGPYYRASSIQSSDPTYCLSSILTVNIISTMNGSTVTCNNTNIGNSAITAAVSSATINVVVSPGPAKSFIVAYTSLNLLTVTWAPPTTSGTPTSYNVSINGSSPVVIADNRSSLYTYTFTGLISDTLYTVSVVAINCAGQNETMLVQQTSSLATKSSSDTVATLTDLDFMTPVPYSTGAGTPQDTADIYMYVGITCTMFFSLGAFVATSTLCVCYIIRKSSPVGTGPSSTHRVVSELSECQYTATQKHEIKNNIDMVDSIDLNSNAAYGTLH